jgi:hypothetical protein
MTQTSWPDLNGFSSQQIYLLDDFTHNPSVFRCFTCLSELDFLLLILFAVHSVPLPVIDIGICQPSFNKMPAEFDLILRQLAVLVVNRESIVVTLSLPNDIT